MSHAYRAIGWNRQKKIYDRTLWIAVVLYLGVFVGLGAVLRPNATLETLLIRALGTGAFLLLHVTLSIGPLCRLDRRFLPLLYNRRHLGVAVFVLGLAHGGFAVFQFHTLGNVNPFVSVLTSNGRWGDLAQFPFHSLGAAALVILFLMAATSHDFWLANLTPPVWKKLHMLVYVAYALLVAHVALGVLQAERHPALAALLAVGMVWVFGLHLVAGWRERSGDRQRAGLAEEGFVDVCGVDEIPEKRAHVACLSGERVAVFRYDGRISAVSNVCQHQNGPLGEGRIIDGCITCPWHGFQYEPENGSSPPPFTEKVPTFRVRLAGDRVLVDPRPYPAGTPVEAALISPPRGGRPMTGKDDFYVGYQKQAPGSLAKFLRAVVLVLAVAGIGVAALLASLQNRFDPGDFEFGKVRSFAGLAYESPYPLLAIDPGIDVAGETTSRFLLVAVGKRGAGAEIEGLDGRRVHLEGTLIYRQGETMIEVVSGSVEPLEAAPVAASAGTALGTATLRGEIVDSKCFFGVMKPGRGKTHRACATRCISGGVPPVLRVETATGEYRHYLLTDRRGRPVNDRVLDLVAEPVEITGEVVRRDSLWLLEADPETYLRLGE